VTGYTPYSSLPAGAKSAIDSIHELILRHRRTMLNVASMSPSLLNGTENGGDSAGGPDVGGAPLYREISSLKSELRAASSEIDARHASSRELERRVEKSTKDALVYAVWPVQTLATRRGVELTEAVEGKKGDGEKMKNKLRTLLDMQAGMVDRVEKIPSPFLWDKLRSFQNRFAVLKNDHQVLCAQLATAQMAVKNQSHAIKTFKDVALIVQAQNDAFMRVASAVATVHNDLQSLKLHLIARHSRQNPQYKDPFRFKDAQEAAEEKKIKDQIRCFVVMEAPPLPALQPAPAPTGLFGAPAPTGGLFGAPVAAPAGGLFGAPAAAPAGGLFGAPAAAPAGGLFGAPAAAPAGGVFGASAPSASNKSKSKSRSGRSRR